MFRDLDEYLDHQKAFLKAWGQRDKCVLLINPEQLNDKKFVARLRRVSWDRFIWDEAQRLKNRTSVSSRAAALIAQSAKRRLALTGTPIDKNPRDMWAIMRFIMVSVFGDRWKDFEDNYIEDPEIEIDPDKMKGRVYRQRMLLALRIAKNKAPIKEGMMEEYAKKIAPHVKRISKEDAGIKPAKVKILDFDLDPQEDAAYRQLEKTMVVKKGKVVVKTPLKITQMVKLQQITGGYIKDEDGELHRLGTTKRRRLRAAIQRYTEPGKPFVIFCKFVWEVHMIERMIKRMGYERTAKLWGKVKDLKRDKRRTNMLLGFQKGDYDVMVCQQRTGGVGVDLYRARRFFVYSMGHSFIDYDQMLSRGDFLEQTERAKFFLLVVKSSIDSDIVVSVEDKKSITEAFYARLKQKGHTHGESR